MNGVADQMEALAEWAIGGRGTMLSDVLYHLCQHVDIATKAERAFSM